jgi:acyl carrier protein
MKEEIFQKVAELIAANNDIAVETIAMDSTFQELSMDSLDGLALITDLEGHYNINIPNAEALKIRTVSGVVEKLEELLMLQQ